MPKRHRFKLLDLFSPAKIDETISGVKEYDCKACGRKYEVLEKLKLNWVRTSMIVLKPALNNVKNALPNVKFEDIFDPRNVVGITKINDLTYHVVFMVSKVKGYLEFEKTKQILVLVGAWRLY